jgi:RNA polymerase sigma-70 factor, ECF subfamily
VPTEIEQLYREHRVGLVRLVERELHDHHEAEDVVQTAFLDAQRAIERGTVPRNPQAWLAAIALNAARRLRGRRLNAEPLEDYAIQEASEVAELHAALTRLPRQQQTAVVYRDVLGLSYDETAEQMGTSVNAVTMLLYRGRQRLRETLGVNVGALGLWRWFNRAGSQGTPVVKGAAAAIAAAGLATGGFVAAGRATQAVAPTRADTSAAAAVLHSGGRPAGALAHDATPRRSRATRDSRESPPLAPAPTPGSSGVAPPASAAPATTGAAASALSTLIQQVPSVPLPALTVPTLPAAVTVTTPVTAVTVTVPVGTTVTLPTPITTVTVPIP